MNKPTRITKTSSAILHHIYTNNIESAYPHILRCDVSDHLPTRLINHVNAVKHKTPYHIKVEDINDEKLVDDLEYLPYQIESLAVSNKNINDKFKDFVEMMQHACDNPFPHKKKLSRKKSRLYQRPWISKAILVSIKKKNYLYRQCCKKMNREKLEEYKKYQNMLTHIKEKAKQNYFKCGLDSYYNNKSKSWKVVNKLQRKNKTKPSLPHKIV